MPTFVYEGRERSDRENACTRPCTNVWLHSFVREWQLSACVCACTSSLCCFSPRYNSEGRVTNITLPTGEVSGFHGNLERWSRVEVEASNRENFVTSTNLSASDTIYTFRQGTASWGIFPTSEVRSGLWLNVGGQWSLHSVKAWGHWSDVAVYWQG